MKLPERDCYTLEEVARRWQCDVSEVHHFIAMDLLVPSIFVDQYMPALYYSSMFDPDDGSENVTVQRDTADEYNQAKGLVSLWGIRTGPMEKRFTLFYTGCMPPLPMYRAYTFETVRDKSLSQLYSVKDLKNLGPDGEIPKERLVIAAAEVKRFEAEYINPTQDGGVQPGPAGAKDLSTREKNSLLTIVAALCNYSDIDIAKRGTAGQISELTRDIGSPLDEETIRKYLKLIPDALK